MKNQHMDPDENILVAFEIDWDPDPPNVQQTKWALTGRLLDTQQMPPYRCLVGRVDKKTIQTIIITASHRMAMESSPLATRQSGVCLMERTVT